MNGEKNPFPELKVFAGWQRAAFCAKKWLGQAEPARLRRCRA